MDSVVAINTDIDNAEIGSEVTLPPGPIDVTAEDGLRFFGKNRIRLKANPLGTTLFRTDGGPVLSFLNSTRCRASDLVLQPGAGGIGVDLQWDGGSNFNTNQNVLDNLEIAGGRLAVRNGDGTANSVSETSVAGGQYSGQTEATFLLDSGNGQNFTVDGTYTIGSPWMMKCLQGSFRLRNMTSVVHAEGVIEFVNLLTASTVDACYCEQTPRFLLTGGPSGVAFPFTIRGSSLYTGTVAGHETEAIRYLQGGPLLIEGSMIGGRHFPSYVTVGGFGATPAAVKHCSFWDMTGPRLARGPCSIENCTISSSTDAWPPKPYSAPVWFK